MVNRKENQFSYQDLNNLDTCYVVATGYRYLHLEKKHPRAFKEISQLRKGGSIFSYVTEQELVMENELGRYLNKDEVVRHKNGVTYDNRIENLELIYRKK